MKYLTIELVHFAGISISNYGQEIGIPLKCTIQDTEQESNSEVNGGRI